MPEFSVDLELSPDGKWHFVIRAMDHKGTDFLRAVAAQQLIAYSGDDAIYVKVQNKK